MIYIFHIILCLFVTSAWAQPQPISPHLANGKIIATITILGLQRTNPDIALREIPLKQQQVFTLEKYQLSIQRLKNLRLFSTVLITPYLTDNKELLINIELNEKWTTLPVFKVTQGGGTQYLVAGLYDINTGGQYLETGIQYESWNEEAGGVVWLRQPRFMQKSLKLGADLWSVKRPRELYAADGESLGSFVLDEDKLNLFIDREYGNWLTLGMGMEYRRTGLLAVEKKPELDMETSLQLDEQHRSTWTVARLYTKLGQLNYDNFLIEGTLSEFVVSRALSNSESQFTRFDWDNRIFITLPYQANLGMRLRLGSTTGSDLENVYYLGGFEHIRGYEDGQFRGRRFWHGNLEYRVPFYKLPWLVLQANTFVDAAQILRAVDEDDKKADNLHYSWGMGIRFISPRIYRFIGRLDLTLDTGSSSGKRVSFGVQQFF